MFGKKSDPSAPSSPTSTVAPSEFAVQCGLPGVLTIDMKITEEAVSKGFKACDYNDNGILSLAEVDKALLMLYPHLAKNKPVLMRAYKAADADNTGFIEKKEFAELLYFLAFYQSLYEIFQLGSDASKRMDFAGLKQAAPAIGLGKKTEEELKAIFKAVDVDNGGKILFDEFCVYMAKLRVAQLPGFISKRAQNNTVKASLEATKTSASKPKSSKATPPVANAQVKPRSPSKAAAAIGLPPVLSLDMKLTPAMLDAGFKVFDTDSTGRLSLAEIDKVTIDLYPEMAAYKSALMRAYKAADADKSGFIEKKEFAELLFFMAFYDSMFQQFQLGGDLDKRMDFAGFKKVAPSIGLEKKTEDQLRAIYTEIDADGGGLVLFDEFCVYMAKLRVSQLPGFIQKAAVKNTTTGGAPRTAKYSLNDKKAGPKKTGAATAGTTGAGANKGESRKSAAANGKSGETATAKKAPNATKSAAPAPTQQAKRPSSKSSDVVLTSSGKDTNSLERKLLFAETENRRLELQVQILREQVERLGGTVDDKKIHKYSMSLDSYATNIAQLTDKLSVERARYATLQHDLQQANDRIRDLNVSNRKEISEDAKNQKSNQLTLLSKQLTQLKIEKDKYVVMNQELAQKLSLENERNRKLVDEMRKKSIK